MAPPYKDETRTCILKQSKKTTDTTGDTAAEHVVMCGGECDRAATRERSVKEHLIVGMGEGMPGGGWGGRQLVVHGETPCIRDTKGLAPHTPTPKQCSKPVAVRPVDSCTFRSTLLASVCLAV